MLLAKARQVARRNYLNTFYAKNVWGLRDFKYGRLLSKAPSFKRIADETGMEPSRIDIVQAAYTQEDPENEKDQSEMSLSEAWALADDERVKAREEEARKEYGIDDKISVLDRLLAKTCTKCGETFYTTMKRSECYNCDPVVRRKA